WLRFGGTGKLSIIGVVDKLEEPFLVFFFFFFNDTATTEIYTLSLHDALPIPKQSTRPCCVFACRITARCSDRKSTRLNSIHITISYAVFCLKKKKKKKKKVSIKKKKIQNIQILIYI